jgi:hypothetical protein
MFNPFWPLNASFALSLQAARMYWQAQAVIFLRCLRIAQGGAKAEAETTRTITEKVAALAEAQVSATAAALAGSKKHAIAKKTMGFTMTRSDGIITRMGYQRRTVL